MTGNFTAPKGAITALLTPFRDGRINCKIYEADVERQIENGVAGLVACGTTAEAPTLSEYDRNWLIRAAVGHAAGRVPVIAGTGSNDTAGTIERTHEAARLGIDAALVVTPYYNKPSQEGLYRHFEAVAAGTDIPLIIYNVPARTGVDLADETVARLAALDGIVGIKEASADPQRCRRRKEAVRRGFMVYSGDDASTLHAILSGADGAISVVSNAFPSEWSTLCRLALNGRDGDAKALHRRLEPLLEALTLESNPCPIKYLMSLVCAGHSNEVRLPLTTVGPVTASRIREALDAFTRAGAPAAA